MTDSDTPSIVEVLRSDHASITELFTEPRLTDPDEHGTALREQLVTELVRHFVAEEQYLLPELRERVTDGRAVADAAFARDRGIEKQLRALEHDHDAQRLAQIVADVRTAFAAHVSEQDGEFQVLTASTPPERLTELGLDALGAEQLAPTRPRSVAPESAAASKVTSLVEGYIDKARDYYSRRGVDPDTDRLAE